LKLPCVSRQHLSITVKPNGSFVIEDLGSSNGTIVTSDGGKRKLKANKAYTNDQTGESFLIKDHEFKL